MPGAQHGEDNSAPSTDDPRDATWGEVFGHCGAADDPATEEQLAARRIAGDTLRHIRIAARVPLEEAPAVTGFSETLIDDWESGRGVATITQVRELACRYGITPDVLINGILELTRPAEGL
ncbi:helix-turn-helix domain-containing protein [Nocardia sp. XZ_19_369]|uniref:helix-turn-helix domain-containing protein n=1 Tax=Nocardia sp. XZ_19_369 TaxID=2769487 RepID=UPI00188F18D6|nr:helix-turn-helix transcriptional regulator [Nocardia sp. XZ_19_369]